MKQGGKIRLSVGRTGPCTPRTRYFSPLQAFFPRCGQGRIPLPLLFPRSAPFSAGKRGRPRPARPAFCPEDTEKKRYTAGLTFLRPWDRLPAQTEQAAEGSRPVGSLFCFRLRLWRQKPPHPWGRTGAGHQKQRSEGSRPWGGPAGKNAGTEKSPAEARFPSLYKREEKIRQTPPPISPKRPALQKNARPVCRTWGRDDGRP